MAKTLLLDRTAWDLVLDAAGNIALADEPYAIAQDVSSAVRTFLGECWYNTDLGIPYWQKILGEWPPIALVKTKIIAVALKVPGVVSAHCEVINFSGRLLTGRIIIQDIHGQLSAADL